MKLFLLLTLFFVFCLFSCQNNTYENEHASVIDSTTVTGLTGDSVKLTKTAGLNIKVKNVEQTTRAVSEVVRKSGGMIYNQHFRSAEVDRKELMISTDSLMIVTTISPQSDMIVRIPSKHLEDFMYKVADLGYFTTSSTLDIDDKSLTYLQNVLKQQNRTEVLSLPTNRSVNSRTSLETISVKDDLIDQQIQNRVINSEVNYSTVHLHLFQNTLIIKEVMANHDVSTYQVPFGQRLENALLNGLQYFLTFLIVLAHLWIFILIAIVILVLYRYYIKTGKLSALKVN